MSDFSPKMQLGTREILLEIDEIRSYKHTVRVWKESLFRYRIVDWMPLNQDNYHKFLQTEGLKDKYALLESILIGNILSFAKGVGVFLEERVVCSITDISDSHIETYKGNEVMTFNASFSTNVSIPKFVGMGKGASLGFGTIYNNSKHSSEI